MAEQAERRNAMGDHVEVLSQEEVQARVHSPSYVGALFDHDGTALVDPARLVWGLERVCISLGVRIYENSKVEWLEDLHDAVRVHTPYGAVTAARVALGTNVFPSLLKKTRKYVVPVYDYVMVTEPLSDAQLESIGWSGREGIADSGNQFHYYRLTSDNSILWGGYDTIYNFRGKVRREYEFNSETYATLGRPFLEDVPAVGRGQVHARLGRRDRHLHPVLTVLGNLAREQGRLRARLHRTRRRLHQIRGRHHAGPPGRARDRPHPI